MSAPEPGSPEWLKLVTASKVSAILGVSPWESPRSLWHKMRGELPRDEGNKNTRRGQYLEAGVLAWWQDQHTLEMVLPQFYATRADLPWAAATLDALADDDQGNTIVVEVKTAARADEWGTPGTDEIPTYYLAQVQWQLAMVPEAQFACVAVLLGPGLDLVEYVIERDDDLIAALVERCRVFYESLTDDDAAPMWDDSVASFECAKALHPDIDGTDLEVTDDLGREYVEATAADKAATARARLAKTVLLDAMGNARRALVDGTPIARRQPGKGGVSLYTLTKTLAPKEAA